ncbi:acyltransferase [Photobacterium sp. CCB-ST2H9]|uniref:acyltransferase n=1 Tax=Photobacterium sp. CCB-ST2H9 TaxID=2912855 RepID=UPI0020035186|nr:acyltransferase [Photobacterium sp. CCB-ST2H9]UTM56555.1 acyltransferase [Photobacterium sp. CCB-ST2H9]
MRGAGKFKLFKSLINALSRFLSFFPLTFRCFLFDFFSTVPTTIGIGLRYAILKSICKSIGDNVYIGRFVVIKNAESLNVGSNVSIHDFTYIDALSGINIGDNVSIAHNSSFISFEHSWDDLNQPIKYNRLTLKPITIESDVWIGCGCRILAGSKVSERSVVAAATIVNKKYPPNVLIAGVPGKIIRDI